MRPRAFDKFLLAGAFPYVMTVFGCIAAFAADPVSNPALSDTPPPLGTSPAPATISQPPASAAVTPGASAPAKSGKRPRRPRDPNAAPKPPRRPKEIPFPLPINEDAVDLVLPENSSTGTLLMNLMTVKARRISDNLVQMNETHVDVNHPDGTEDFHIDLPTSVFDLKTHIISSEQPVTVRTKDFELTGERMEFNTVDRTGKLLGQVHMHIHNFKQLAGPPQTSPTPPTP